MINDIIDAGLSPPLSPASSATSNATPPTPPRDGAPPTDALTAADNSANKSGGFENVTTRDVIMLVPELSSDKESHSRTSNSRPTAPGENDTLVSVLKTHVEKQPNRLILTWLDEKGNESQHLTYIDLWQQSTGVVSLLRSNGVQQGDRVMIAYPFGLEFLAGIVGCMRAGVIACSVYPPNPAKASDLEAFQNQVNDAGANFALTTTKFKLYLGFRLFGSAGLGVKWIATDRSSGTANVDEESLPTQESTAFIQYTSGSTGSPKGVIISHRSLIHNVHNCMVVGDLHSPDEPKVGVSWLPQYHDMGLLGYFMTAIYSGFHGISFSPIDFIQNPLLWHEAVVKYKAHSTLAPNFSYGLLVKRLQQSGKHYEKWTSIRTLINAAEPVDPTVMEQAKEVLGVKPEYLRVGYGMAELGVAAGWAKYTVNDNLVASVPVDGTTSIHSPAALRVVDSTSGNPKAVADGTIGEIWIRAPYLVADGYWNKPELTNETFRNKLQDEDGDWLSTGDLGKVVDDNIYVTGRSKEVIILNGRNVFPVDIERAVEKAYPETVRPGCIVAFQNEEDNVGLVLEIRKGKTSYDAPTAKELCSMVSSNCDVALGYVCILQSHTIPKTTSGKLKRVETQRKSRSNQWSTKDTILVWSRDQPLKKTSAAAFDVAVVYKTFQDTLGFSVDPADKLTKLGLSSMKAVELHTALCENLSLEPEAFPVTWLMDEHITVSDIIGRLEPKELKTPSSSALANGWNRVKQIVPAGQLLSPTNHQVLALSGTAIGAVMAKLIHQNGLPIDTRSLETIAALAAGGFLAASMLKPPTPSRPEAYIAATGVGFVGDQVSTDEMMKAIQFAREDFGQDDDAISFSHKMAKSTGIQTRHLALPAYHGTKESSSTGLSENLLSHLKGKKPHELSSAERSDIWWDVAQKASLASARAALEDWATKPHPAHRGNASDITHVITTTASGWREPGIAGHLIKELGLRHDVQKQELHMNGCFAAATCLRAARDIVRAGSDNSAAREGTSNVLDDGQGNTGRRCVLVVGVEVPSAHHDITIQDREDILAMSLFCDGSGAAIIAPEGEWRFRESGCHVIPESKTLLGLIPDHPDRATGYKMKLSKEVPAAIYEYFSNGNGRRIIDRFKNAVGGEKRPAMAVHPGGPRILGAVHKAIVERGWPDDALRTCENTFFQRGNLGSTATLVVLHDILKDKDALRHHDDLGVLAFGPGVTVEYALLRRRVDG